ncbi:MAG TPA: serine O-acetyltransferase EpsC [Bacteroidales bacterium]|nr:serine O-acetyltransferase EpsC [Bacteroidales bacterium]
MPSALSKMIVYDKKITENTVKKIFKLMFPHNEKLIRLEACFNDKALDILLTNVLKNFEGDSEKVKKEFIDSLVSTKSILLKDAQFILESDPAAKELTEVIAIYPGFFAIFCHRIAHTLYTKSVHLIPRIITEYAHIKTGIDIHPGARIGIPFSIDHGTGIVIGETTIIGNNVKMYQGVTLGALSVDKSKASTKRHPTIEDNVILYAGSTILGGNTVVGRNSIIGGNVWLTESLAPNTVVYHKSEIIVRNQSDFNEPINWVI